MKTIRAQRAERERLAREDPAAYRRLIENELPENTCCLCRTSFKGHGHNPLFSSSDEIQLGGVACDECNMKIVSKQRIPLGLREVFDDA